jgi:hypothetical protein
LPCGNRDAVKVLLAKKFATAQSAVLYFARGFSPAMQQDRRRVCNSFTTFKD